MGKGGYEVIREKAMSPSYQVFKIKGQYWKTTTIEDKIPKPTLADLMKQSSCVILRFQF
jgi:hypothetical protein